jgi:hypothetical protein
MLDVVAKLFTRKDPHRDAVLGLARIISRYDMVRLSYEQGLVADRRDRMERHVAIGVWLFPCKADSKAHDWEPSAGIPAVTRDLRNEGFGVMTPIRLSHGHYFVAAPDEEGGSWRFFKCEVRHNTEKIGGWHHLGLHVDRTIELDCAQRLAFREHISRVEAEAGRDWPRDPSPSSLEC